MQQPQPTSPTPSPSLRDYFAAAALQGLLASDVSASVGEFAKNAYAVADAMLKARKQ